MHSECHWSQDIRLIFAYAISLSCPCHWLYPLIWMRPLTFSVGGHLRISWVYFMKLSLFLSSTSLSIFSGSLSLVLALDYGSRHLFHSVSCTSKWSLNISRIALRPVWVHYIRLLLEADPSYIVFVHSCIIFGMILPSQLTNRCHLLPKGLNINMWMENLKFITILRKTILQAFPDGEFLFSNQLCFLRLSHYYCNVFV